MDFVPAMKLGFGLMRLPRLDDNTIDVAQTSDMVDRFMEAGGTYFDTAYAYEGSEEAIRKALVERYPRDSYTLTTKLIAFGACKNEEMAKQEIYTSLERTGAGYFDYYLLHRLPDITVEFPAMAQKEPVLGSVRGAAVYRSGR